MARPLVLLWSDPWFDVEEAARTVAASCELTDDTAAFPFADAVVFPLPTLSHRGEPPPARCHNAQVWVAWCAESAVQFPQLDDPAFIGAFDLVMSYRLDSDLPIPYVDSGAFEQLPRIVPLVRRRRTPVAAFVSSPHDRCGRDDYLAELMRHVAVDSYGKVWHNRDLPADLGRASKLEAVARYRFTVAFENSIDRDYVTEKLFDPLLLGSVPIYRGAPNVAAFAPGEHCFVDADAFDGPRDLARFLIEMSDGEYRRYHAWRRRPLRPEFVRLCEQVEGHGLERLARALPVLRFGRHASARRRAEDAR